MLVAKPDSQKQTQWIDCKTIIDQGIIWLWLIIFVYPIAYQ